MEKSAKTDNFLKAIKKYADEQRQSMQNEVNHLKETKLKEAEEKGKADSEKYIGDMLEKKRNEETGKIAKLTQEGQRKLFLKRFEMTESIFKKAEEKLIAYTKTKEYNEKLKNSAANISDVFNNKDCVITIKPDDIDKTDIIKAAYAGNIEITVDKSIKIGGIKGYCAENNVVADDTLDSKLSEQKQWFIENSNLNVL